MRAPSPRLNAAHKVLKGGDLCDFTLGESGVNSWQGLHHDATCAQVKMANFRIADLSFRQSDRFAARRQGRARATRPEAVKVRGLRLQRRVMLCGGSQTPTV